jgi:hypothetical protein
MTTTDGPERPATELWASVAPGLNPGGHWEVELHGREMTGQCPTNVHNVVSEFEASEVEWHDAFPRLNDDRDRVMIYDGDTGAFVMCLMAWRPGDPPLNLDEALWDSAEIEAFVRDHAELLEQMQREEDGDPDP